ncbi:MAG: hypothetical protein KKB31_05855 [Nanoarchaeota archaeon]|nr:hypothetical protein [Nanoarchaeota archaeon]
MSSLRADKFIIIADKEKREKYVWAILLRMQPYIYNQEKNGCVVIQVMDSLLEFAETIIRYFKFVGLKEHSRKKASYTIKRRDGGSYRIENAWEITLKKIKAIKEIEDDGGGLSWTMWHPE